MSAILRESFQPFGEASRGQPADHGAALRNLSTAIAPRAAAQTVGSRHSELSTRQPESRTALYTTTDQCVPIRPSRTMRPANRPDVGGLDAAMHRLSRRLIFRALQVHLAQPACSASTIDAA
jgi:hypothetical protein